MNLFILFCLLNIANVVLQTAKSIITVKCGRTVASIANAVAFFLYTYVIFYTMCELPLFVKALVVGICNLIGVFIVKTIEEKMRKDKLWRFDCSVPKENVATLKEVLEKLDISVCYLGESKDWGFFQIFAPTQKESNAIMELIKKYNIKYFVNENRAG